MQFQTDVLAHVPGELQKSSSAGSPFKHVSLQSITHILCNELSP